MLYSIISAAIVGAIVIADNKVFNGKIEETTDKIDKIVMDIISTPKEIADFYTDRLN